jgi:tRNA(His) 5'-end guanylyltransferase
MSKDNLGDRMKSYENIERKFLTRRIPTLIRLDGKAFHSFTKGFQKPFDIILMKSMWETVKYLCANIQGCKVGYTQSDEITLLLTDYETITTDAWFEKNVQKMCSVSASMATLSFNKFFTENVWDYQNSGIDEKYENFNDKDIEKYTQIYHKKFNTALFDSRVYNLPKEEVCNAFIWRQQDATRNAIQMVGQANFPHKQLQNKNCNQIQEILFQEKNINFNDLPTCQKRGICVIKELYMKGDTQRTRWTEDMNIPIFTQDRNYIEKYL